MTLEEDSRGWLWLNGVLDEESIAVLTDRLRHYEEHPQKYREALEFQQEGDDGPVRKMRQLHLVETDVWSVLWTNDAVQGLLEKHADEPMAVVFCAAFLKPSEVGSRVPFHQDQALWSRELPGAFSCWVALDDADEDNGCLVLSEGSHLKGVLPHEEPAGGGHPEVQADILADLPKEPSPLAPGDAVVWDRLVVHGSPENRSARSRRGVVAVYAPQRLRDEGFPVAGPASAVGRP